MIKEAHENLITGKTFEVVILIRRSLELLNSHTYFCCLITYGVCKKRKYCNRMSEKKNSRLLTNFHVLYVLEDKTSKKNPSVCLSVRGLLLWTQ